MNPAQGPRRPRQTKTVFTTKSGKSLQMNRSFSERRRAKKDARARKRAAYLSTLPKNRWKRLAYRMHPKRVIKYWFSREGAIMMLKIAGIGMIIGFLLLVGLFAYFRKDLPDIKDVSGNNQPGSISYYDRSGKTLLLQDYDALKRIPVKGEEISEYMKQATIAIEDKEFYHEGAFNVRGIVRAAVNNVFNRSGGLQGGSTITQQLVKLNEGWTADRSITRKVKEVILAVELEREYSKDDILTGYLNIAPYGNIQNGVEAAAKDYFHTSAAKLTLAQAAMLASIPQDPPYYSPYSSPKYNPAASVDYFGAQDLLDRQHYVLDQMVKQGMVSREKAEAAKKVDILAQVRKLQPKDQNIKAPYFVLAAKQELEQKFGSETVHRGGWKVTTTLDLKLQRLAEDKVRDNLPNVQSSGGDQEAMAAEDVKTGQMVALVGGVDYNNEDYGKINYAQHNIPPGSSFKPYDYAALINYSKNVGAGSVLYDTQGPVVDPETKAGYYCTNKRIPKFDKEANCIWDYDFKYPGPLTLRYSLAGSRNVPAIKAMVQVGVDKTIKMANEMMGNQNGYQCFADEGLTKPGPCYPSAAIGDGAYLHLDEHVNGLATLSRLGNYIPRTYILEIDNASGKPLYKWTQPKAKQVISKDAAYIVNDMLSDPNASYLPYGYKFHNYKGWKFAIKTGTTNNNFDGLMAAWSTKYAVVSWVGHHSRNVELRSGGMELMTTPLTRGWMEGAHDTVKTPATNWEKPSGVKTASAYVVRTHVGVGSVEPSPSSDLYPSWYQQKTGNTSYTIDKVSKKLATSCTPVLAKLFAGNSNASSFSVDQFVDGGGSGSSGYNTSANDDVHKCSDRKPTVSVTLARIDSSNGNSTGPIMCGDGCAITVTVSQGTHPLTSKNFRGKVDLTINGNVVRTFNVTQGGLQSFTYNFTPGKKSGTSSISAQATDSVLYQGSDSTSASNKSGGNGNGGDSGDDDPFDPFD